MLSMEGANMYKKQNKIIVGLSILFVGVAITALLSGTVAAQTTSEVGFENETVAVGESTDLIATNIPSTAPVGAYEIVLDSEEIDSVTVSGTDRFNVSTDVSNSEKTVVGYTGETSGEGGNTTLATVTIESEANAETTLSVTGIVTLSDTDGNEITPQDIGDSISITASDSSGDSGGDDSSGSSGGGGAGGGGAGGGGSDSSDGSDGPPTIDNVRSTLSLITPDSDTATEIADNDPDTAGVSVNPEGTQSVRQITFNSDLTSGSVEVTEYNNPPEQLATEISTSVAADLDDEANSSTSSDTIGDMRVFSVSDITPTTEAAEDSSATVELTVDRDRVNSPQQLSVVKETYDFEAQSTRWAQQETTVQDTSEEEVTVATEVDSFSLFVVTEIGDGTGGNSGSTNKTGGEPDEESSDFIPGFGFASSIAAFGSLGYLLKRREK